MTLRTFATMAIFTILMTGSVAAIYLAETTQDIRQQARVDSSTGGVVGVVEKSCPGGYANGYQACNPSGGERSYRICDNGTMRTFSCGEGQKCVGGRCSASAQGTTETTGNTNSGSDTGGTGGSNSSDDGDGGQSAPCDSQEFRTLTGTTARPGGKTCSRDLKKLVTCNTFGQHSVQNCANGCMNGLCMPANPVACKVAGKPDVAHGAVSCIPTSINVKKCVNGTFFDAQVCRNGLQCGTLASENTARCVSTNRVADGFCSPTTDASTGCISGKGYTPPNDSSLLTTCTTKIICGPPLSDIYTGCSLTANSNKTDCGGIGQAVCSSGFCATPVPCDSSSYLVIDGKCQATLAVCSGPNTCNSNGKWCDELGKPTSISCDGKRSCANVPHGFCGIETVNSTESRPFRCVNNQRFYKGGDDNLAEACSSSTAANCPGDNQCEPKSNTWCDNLSGSTSISCSSKQNCSGAMHGQCGQDTGDKDGVLKPFLCIAGKKYYQNGIDAITMHCKLRPVPTPVAVVSIPCCVNGVTKTTAAACTRTATNPAIAGACKSQTSIAAVSVTGKSCNADAANSCVGGKWCNGQAVFEDRICGTGKACGVNNQIPELSCDINGQRCINGELKAGYGCASAKCSTANSCHPDTQLWCNEQANITRIPCRTDNTNKSCLGASHGSCGGLSSPFRCIHGTKYYPGDGPALADTCRQTICGRDGVTKQCMIEPGDAYGRWCNENGVMTGQACNNKDCSYNNQQVNEGTCFPHEAKICWAGVVVPAENACAVRCTKQTEETCIRGFWCAQGGVQSGDRCNGVACRVSSQLVIPEGGCSPNGQQRCLNGRLFTLNQGSSCTPTKPVLPQEIQTQPAPLPILPPPATYVAQSETVRTAPTSQGTTDRPGTNPPVPSVPSPRTDLVNPRPPGVSSNADLPRLEPGEPSEPITRIGKAVKVFRPSSPEVPEPNAGAVTQPPNTRVAGVSSAVANASLKVIEGVRQILRPESVSITDPNALSIESTIKEKGSIVASLVTTCQANGQNCDTVKQIRVPTKAPTLSTVIQTARLAGVPMKCMREVNGKPDTCAKSGFGKPVAELPAAIQQDMYEFSKFMQLYAHLEVTLADGKVVQHFVPMSCDETQRCFSADSYFEVSADDKLVRQTGNKVSVIDLSTRSDVRIMNVTMAAPSGAKN